MATVELDPNNTGKIDISFIPTGTTNTKVAFGDHLHTGVYDLIGSADAVRAAHEAAFDHSLLGQSLAKINVVSFGANPLGLTDSTSAIQAAIDSVTSSGGIVYFPEGSYLVSATIVVNKSRVYIEGSASGTAKIFRTTDYGDTFFFTGNDSTGVVIQYVGIQNLWFDSANLVTSGAHIHMNGVNQARIDNIKMNQGFIGFKFAGLTASYISNIYLTFTNIYGGSATGRKYMLLTAAGENYAIRSCGDNFFTDFNMRGNNPGGLPTGTVTEYGLEVTCSDGNWFQNGHIGNTTGANIHLSTSVEATTGLLFFSQVMTDSCLGAGVKFSGTNVAARNVMFTNSIFKGGVLAGTYGIQADAAAKFYNVQFNNCSVTEFAYHGIYISDGNAQNWTFSDIQVRGNNKSGGAYDGAYIDGADKVQILGGSYGGDNLDPGTATQRYGILIGANVSNILVDGVDVSNNLTKGLFIQTSALDEVTVGTIRSDEIVTVASATNITLPLTGSFANITGTNNISFIGGGRYGRQVTLIFSDVLSVIDGSNLKLNGNFVTAAGSTLTLVYDGADWYEVSRTPQSTQNLTAQAVLTALTTAFPDLTITLGSATVPSAGTINTLVSYGFNADNILWADTGAAATLSVGGITSASTITGVTLVRKTGTFVVGSVTSTSAISGVELTQVLENTFVVGNITSASAIDNVILTSAGLSQLIVNNITSASTLDNVIITRYGGTLVVNGITSASTISNAELSEVAGGPLFSETFDSSLGQFSNVTGTWVYSEGRALSSELGEVMSAAIEMSRGFYVEFDLQQNYTPGNVADGSTEICVNSANSISTGNRYSVSVGFYYDDETPEDYADIVIYDNGTIISSANYFTPTDANRRYRIEFQSGGNIVVKDGATGSTPTNTIATVSDSTHTSFSYLLFRSVGGPSATYIDNVTAGDL